MSEDTRLEPTELPILDPAYKAASPQTLRSIAPDGTLRQVKLPSGAVAWLVTDSRLAKSILNDPRISKKRPLSPAEAHEDGEPHSLYRHMLTLDPPEHTRLRASVSADFLPGRIQQHRQKIQSLCDHFIAAISERSEIDLVSEFSRPLALATICSVVGIPVADGSLVQQWSERLERADFEAPGLFPGIAAEMCRYFDALLTNPPAASNGSVLAHLVQMMNDGMLTRQEVFSMIFLLLNAGYETSANLISSGVFALLRNQTQWSALCADSSLVTSCVEELLRLESPLEMATPRFASCDLEIADRSIRKGDMIFVALGAANRDPRDFPDPDRLDIVRPNSNRHLSFGHGVHYCIGAQLARLEGQIAISALSQHFPNLQLDRSKPSPQWIPGVIMRGLSGLPLVLGGEHRFNRF